MDDGYQIIFLPRVESAKISSQKSPSIQKRPTFQKELPQVFVSTIIIGTTTCDHHDISSCHAPSTQSLSECHSWNSSWPNAPQNPRNPWWPGTGGFSIETHPGLVPKKKHQPRNSPKPRRIKSSKFPLFSPYILSQPFPRINLKMVHLQFGLR